MAGAGRSEAEEVPVDAGLAITGVSLLLVAPTPATPLVLKLDPVLLAIDGHHDRPRAGLHVAFQVNDLLPGTEDQFASGERDGQ